MGISISDIWKRLASAFRKKEAPDPLRLVRYRGDFGPIRRYETQEMYGELTLKDLSTTLLVSDDITTIINQFMKRADVQTSEFIISAVTRLNYDLNRLVRTIYDSLSGKQTRISGMEYEVPDHVRPFYVAYLYGKELKFSGADTPEEAQEKYDSHTKVGKGLTSSLWRVALTGTKDNHRFYYRLIRPSEESIRQICTVKPS